MGARGEDLGDLSMTDGAELVRAAHRAALAETPGDDVDRVRRGLIAARDLSRSGEAPCHAGLSLLAAGWTGATGDAAGALACLSDVGNADDGRLALAIAAERAFYRARGAWCTAELDRALDDGRAALEGRRKQLGDDDPDTLRSRSNLAYWTSELGDHTVARAELVAVAESQARVLGAENPQTLISRHNAACEAGEDGDHAVARAEFVAVAEARGRVLGAEHPRTLTSRHNAAYEAGELGDHAVARAELLEIAAMGRSARGSDDEHTLSNVLAAAEMLLEQATRSQHSGRSSRRSARWVRLVVRRPSASLHRSGAFSSSSGNPRSHGRRWQRSSLWTQR